MKEYTVEMYDSEGHTKACRIIRDRIMCLLLMTFYAWTFIFIQVVLLGSGRHSYYSCYYCVHSL